MTNALARAVVAISCFAVSAVILACNSSGMKRPYGFMRLGTLEELSSSETYLPDQRLMVRRDANGFSVMSTTCTFDLTPLTRSEQVDSITWRSSYTESEYAYNGEVKRGPTKHALPYYNIKIDAAVYGGVKDTLYAEVGTERDETWRFDPTKVGGK